VELTLLSKGPQQTIQYGRTFGSVLEAGSVIGLVGELGSGKTCFIKGLASQLAGVPADDVTSPTFTFMQEYPGKIPLYHFDLYRIAGSADLYDLGFEECLYGTGVTVIEWADRAEGALPAACLIIRMEFVAKQERQLTFSAHGAKHAALLTKYKNAL
jgi:tRNA threonylcarbamoyladenosine biosynthesis protein TsaE